MIPPGRIDCHVHFYPPAFADMLLSGESGPGSGAPPMSGPGRPGTGAPSGRPGAAGGPSGQGTETSPGRPGGGGGPGRPPLGAFVLAPKPEWRDLDALGRVMDETGVELGVIIPPASLIERLRTVGAGTTEQFNQSMSDELARGGGRFLAAAIVDPLGGPEEVAQLEHSLALPHLAAVGLVDSYDGRALDDPAFEPIFAAARAHDVPVLVHPSQVPPPARHALHLDHPVLAAGFGFLAENALTILRMALNGTFDRFSDVRFMFCQLGGFAPACCARWDYHAKHQRVMSRTLNEPLPSWAEHTLQEYLSHLWLDTHSQDRHILRLILEMLGDDGIVLGGDFPITPAEDGVLHIMGELDAMDVPDSTRRKIERENAQHLLGRVKP